MSTTPARVPRSAWAAVGAAAAAGAAWLGIPAPAALALGLALIAASAALPGERGRWTGIRAGGIGALLLAIRVLVGPATPAVPPLPDGTGPWRAVVESVGSPRDGSQTARLVLDTEAGQVVVAATLPAYPVVRAGGVVDVSGGVRSPPEDDP